MDRQLHLTTVGQVAFGVLDSGAWQTPASSRSYTNGAQVAASSATVTTTTYAAAFRIGYDNLAGWPSAGSTYFYAGSPAHAAFFDSVLPGSTVAAHYAPGA